MEQSTAIMVLIGLGVLAIICIKLSAEYDKRKGKLKQLECDKVDEKQFDKLIKLEDIYIGGTYECNYIGFNDQNGIIEVYNVDSATAYEADKIVEEYTVDYNQLKEISVVENGVELGSTKNTEKRSLVSSYNKKEMVELLEIRFSMHDDSVKTLTLLRVKTRKSMAIYQRNIDRARQVIELGKKIIDNDGEN